MIHNLWIFFIVIGAVGGWLYLISIAVKAWHMTVEELRDEQKL